MPKYILSVKRDTYDARDKVVIQSGPINLPKYFSLEEWTPQIADQGQLGACTAFTAVEMLEFLVKKYWEWVPDKTVAADKLQLSQLFQYYNERVLLGTAAEDSGADSRTMMRALVENGVCLESLYPYNIDVFSQTPPDVCYAQASYKPGAYHRILDVETAKSVIYSGYPFSIGIEVYSSFMSAQVAATGLVPMPQVNDTLEGGHEMWCFAYADDKTIIDPDGQVHVGAFKTRNHWGANWGEGGNCWIPYSYLANATIGMDMWTTHLGKPWKSAVTLGKFVGN
jgi:C1A family cysteine protease